ncbi:interferon alpha-14-like [Ctenodactylus gundi]
MAFRVSVLLALGMLWPSPTCPMGCELTPSHGNRETFALLSRMERVPILLCLRARADFWLPKVLVDGKHLGMAQVAIFLHEMHQQVFTLFSTSSSLAAWDETLLDELLIKLHQQLEDLESCLRKERKARQPPLRSKNSRLAVKKYFKEISLYLKEKNYSHCAWEVVRVEIRRLWLLFMNRLSGKLRSSEFTYAISSSFNSEDIIKKLLQGHSIASFYPLEWVPGSLQSLLHTSSHLGFQQRLKNSVPTPKQEQPSQGDLFPLQTMDFSGAEKPELKQ